MFGKSFSGLKWFGAFVVAASVGSQAIARTHVSAPNILPKKSANTNGSSAKAYNANLLMGFGDKKVDMDGPIQAVYWGSNFAAQPSDYQSSLNSFFSGLAGTNYLAGLVQEYGFGQSGIFSVNQPIIDNSAAFSDLYMNSDPSIAAAYLCVKFNNQPPAGQRTFLFTDQPLDPDSNACGYHFVYACDDADNENGNFSVATYIPVPPSVTCNPSDPSCVLPCGVPPSNSASIQANEAVYVASHEFIESASDPYLAEVYNRPTGSEIADACVYTPVPNTILSNGASFALAAQFSNNAYQHDAGLVSANSVAGSYQNHYGCTNGLTPVTVTITGSATASWSGGATQGGFLQNYNTAVTSAVFKLPPQLAGTSLSFSISPYVNWTLASASPGSLSGSTLTVKVGASDPNIQINLTPALVIVTEGNGVVTGTDSAGTQVIKCGYDGKNQYSKCATFSNSAIALSGAPVPYSYALISGCPGALSGSIPGYPNQCADPANRQKVETVTYVFDGDQNVSVQISGNGSGKVTSASGGINSAAKPPVLLEFLQPYLSDTITATATANTNTIPGQITNCPGASGPVSSCQVNGSQTASLVLKAVFSKFAIQNIAAAYQGSSSLFGYTGYGFTLSSPTNDDPNASCAFSVTSGSGLLIGNLLLVLGQGPVGISVSCTAPGNLSAAASTTVTPPSSN
jgi:hypothetical protein